MGDNAKVDNSGLLDMFSGGTNIFECLSISKLEEASNETKICVGIAIIVLLVGLIIGYLVISGKLDLSDPFNSVKKLMMGGGSNTDISIADPDGKADLILFYANWCDHCKNVKPIWDKLTSEYDGTVIGSKLIEMDKKDGDIEENMKLIEQYNITGYPTIVALINDNVTIMETSPTEENIIEFIQSLK